MTIQELTLDGVPELPQKETLRRIAACLWADPDVAAVWLGGSFARGTADENSDLDLRVAVRPEALLRWQRTDMTAQGLSAQIGETGAGLNPMRWEGTVLYHLLLTNGLIMDFLVQCVERDPPADFTLVLGCRDDAFGQALAAAQLPPPADSLPADPATICQAVTDFWIGSHKHIRVLSRDLDLLVLYGLDLEHSVLMRLWHADATGHDQGTQRPTIHTLTPMVRAVAESVGPHSLEVLGTVRTNRTEIEQAIEAHRNEVAAVGRRLAARLGFAYPDALEQTVRQCWQKYLGEKKDDASTPAPA